MTGGPAAGGADRDGLADRLRTLLRLEALEVTAEGAEGEIAVVRVRPDELPGLMEGPTRERIVEEAKEAGFRYAAVDLGFPADTDPA